MSLSKESQNSKTFIIGVYGPSASGKGHISQALAESIQKKDKKVQVIIISLDWFYKDLTKQQRDDALEGEYNFDCPQALELDEAADRINDLKSTTEPVKFPQYNFKTHSRQTKPLILQRNEIKLVIIVEGLFLSNNDRLFSLCDRTYFIDADANTRLSRRILRDQKERGRQVEDIIKQYNKYVADAYIKFIRNNKKKATAVIPYNVENTNMIDDITTIALASSTS